MKLKNTLLIAVLCACLWVPAVSAQAVPLDEMGHMDVFRTITSAKGKVVVVNFFASWCAPCLQEIPGLIEVRKQYPETEVVFLALSMDTNRAQIEKLLDMVKFNYPVYLAKPGVQQVFQVATLPKMLVYSKAGTLAYSYDKMVTEDELKRNLDDLLTKQ